jgi:hypothetical protein
LKIIKESEVLKSKAKTGKLKFWKAQVVSENGKYYTRTEFWQSDGKKESKHNISIPYECTPKNIGKSNETTPKEQAEKEMEAMFKKQRDQGYVGLKEDLSSIDTGKFLPMLAHCYHDTQKLDKDGNIKVVKGKKDKVIWPAAAQPKLDGARALFNSSEGFWTRKGKQWIPEVVAHLEFDPKEYTFDGELMIPHEDASFQLSMKAAKKYRKGISEKLHYFIYDVVEPSLTFKERYEIIKKFKFNNKSITLVPTVIVNNEKEFFAFHKTCVEKGFEGAMIRNLNGLYSIRHRSNELLKYKDFMEEEFEVVDVIEAGSGSFTGCGKFKIKVGKMICDVNPEGPLEGRKKYLINKKEYIGKLLTVKFQGFTDDGSLRFPVGKGIRDYE